MSQFRIKHIDQGLPDEWVFRKNDEGIQLGDDIDARDPNELAEAIIDIQNELLKTSTLAAAGIIKPNSGIAERLTVLEQTAGQATLQDIYENGNYISILGGRPLVLGAREEIKIDDNGNLSFRPVTMRVKGTGNAYVELSNSAIYATLGDLLLGAVSPGQSLSLRSGLDIFFQDGYLTNPVSISQSGNTKLNTVSQSLVGAINELKASTFSVNLQSVYNQSSPPKVITNISAGPLTVEDANPTSIADAFKVIGNQTVTKKLVAASLKIGNNTNIADSTGISTTDKIKTTIEIETPKVNSGISELILKDKRGSFQLSENAAAALSTNSATIIGAINELKQNIDNVGGNVTTYGAQHNPTTGAHEIITTQAAVGANSVKRFIVKNQTGAETFSVTGEGNLVANALVLSGLNVVNLLNLLNAHLADDGSSHSALANHLSASNPHNTVKSILGLRNDILLGSPDGSIGISISGNTINFSSIDNSDLQSVYNKAASKRIDLTVAGLVFRDGVTSNEIFSIKDSEITSKRAIVLPDVGAEIRGTNDLNVRGTTNLKLFSDSGDIKLETPAAKAILLQNVPFDEVAVKTLPRLEGSSVLGHLKKIDEDKSIEIYNQFELPIKKGQTVCLDVLGNPWYPISTIHPANEFVTGVDFFFTNKGNRYVAAEDVAPFTTGKFYKSGVILANIGAGLDAWLENKNIYLGRKGSLDIDIVNFAGLTNGTLLTIDTAVNGLAQEITGVTGVPSINLGQYKIENTGNANNDADKTRDNIVALLNDATYNATGDKLDCKATIDGESAKAIFKFLNVPTAGTLVELQASSVGGANVTFTCVSEGTTPGYLQFKIGITPDETAYNLAELINKTTFYRDAAETLVGHYCYAEAVGSMVRITYYKPGFAGRNIIVATNMSGSNVLYSQFSGGTCRVRVYRQDISTSVLTNSSSNTAITISNLTGDETSAQYILEDRALSKKRKVANELKIKIGTIEDASGNNVKFRIA